jgi:hypothetical protein
MLTQRRLMELFELNLSTGIFTRKINHSSRKAGEEAGTLDAHGYRTISVDRKNYKAHRLIWLYVHGHMPTSILDHINGNRLDNRIENLRLADRRGNNCNKGKLRTNRSGWKGVSFHPQSGKWRATIMLHKRQTHVGLYSDPLDAASAYNLAAYKLHGNFANYNEPEGEAIIFA